MKLTTGLSLIGARNVEKNLSKKILLANTSGKLGNSREVTNKRVGVPADPLYFTDSANTIFNPDIRYNYGFGYSPLTNISYRNGLLILAENLEIEKACRIISDECVASDLKSNKYPVYPLINETLVPEDKKEISKAIQNYLDDVFYPKLWQFSGMKEEDGMWKTVNEYLKTGKLAYEILYDDLENPTEIVGMIPIDPASLQKFKRDGFVWYMQRPIIENTHPRILSENQVVLIEWNEYDYGYVSYVDKLRRPFNIMRSMMTSKIMWFAAKSQVRMHIKLAMGDITREDAKQRLGEAVQKLKTSFSFDDENGQVMYNNKPNVSSYKEFYTAETMGSGTPEIDEIIGGSSPNLEEVDSLMFWEKLYWKSTDIPFDRVDPQASDTWGFLDVANIRKIELNFAKMISKIRLSLSQIFLKPIIIQLTLKETEIGADLTLLDLIKMYWVSYNEYEKLGELELINKKVELCKNLSEFGEMENAQGNTISYIPITWLIKNYLDFTPDQLESMEAERKVEYKRLGFNEDGSTPEEEETEVIDDGFGDGFGDTL